MGTRDKRRDVIATRLLASNADILEIGALDSPTFQRPDHRAWFADYTDTTDLARKGSQNPRYERSRLVEVDYPIRGRRYPDVVDRTFDLIVANHVIEHVPDVIAWVDDLGHLLNDGGILFLSVPDRRYTFDILRRDTTVTDLIGAHESGKTRPDFADILEHFWETRPVKAPEIWAGTHLPKLAKPRWSAEETLRKAREMASHDYQDVHCHVFTQSSFTALFTQLRAFGLLNFAQVSVGTVERNANEFHVFLSGFAPPRTRAP